MSISTSAFNLARNFKHEFLLYKLNVKWLQCPRHSHPSTRPASLHANAHGPSRALLAPIEGKVVEGFMRARHGVQVVVDVVPVAQGVPPPPQREVGVLQEQRAVQHTLLVNLGPEQEDLHAAGHDAGVALCPTPRA